LLSRYRLSNCIPKIMRACCALQSAVNHALQIFVNNPQNWWSMDTPFHVKFLWLFGGSGICLTNSATATQLSRRFHQCMYALRPAAARTPVDCSELFTSSLLMLFFVQALLRNFVINCQTLQPLHSYKYLIKILFPLLNRVKVAAFAWYSVKIRVILGVRFERRKVD